MLTLHVPFKERGQVHAMAKVSSARGGQRRAHSEDFLAYCAFVIVLAVCGLHHLRNGWQQQRQQSNHGRGNR